MKTKVAKYGFVWLIVSDDLAMEMWKSKDTSLYILYDDDSETRVETYRQLISAMLDREQIGVEIGFVRDLLPVCPKCGHKLSPSDNPGYVWKCYECDEDFYSFEI